MGKDEVVHFFASYARGMGAPIREGAAARRLRRDEAADRYLIDLGDEIVGARNVVVATGAYERARVPRGAAGLSGVTQLHSDTYRNAAELPDGAVLVVGSGQSGCQIAEDLREAGRVVYLSTGGAGWFPRRYRGRDNLWWREQMGYFDHSVDTLTSPADRMNAVPVQTGRGGGHDINLRTLAAMGVTLAGRFVAAEGGTCGPPTTWTRTSPARTGWRGSLWPTSTHSSASAASSAPPDELQIPESGSLRGLAGDIDLGRSRDLDGDLGHGLRDLTLDGSSCPCSTNTAIPDSDEGVTAVAPDSTSWACPGCTPACSGLDLRRGPRRRAYRGPHRNDPTLTPGPPRSSRDANWKRHRLARPVAGG